MRTAFDKQRNVSVLYQEYKRVNLNQLRAGSVLYMFRECRWSFS